MSGFTSYFWPPDMFGDWAYHHATEDQLREGLEKAEQAIADARREVRAYKKVLKDRKVSVGVARDD